MRHLELSGSPATMGAAFGEECRGQIDGLYEARMKNAIEQAFAYGGRTVDEGDLLDIARSALPIVKAYAPRGFEEIAGIAKGAGRPVEQIWAMNALTDLRDVAAFGDPSTWGGAPEGEGCSSFVVAKDRAAEGRALVGQTWDLSTDNLPYVLIVERTPIEGPRTRTLTTAGCLSLIGINEAGVAIGTTNIRTLDARLGVGYLDVIHAVLATHDLQEATQRIVDAPRAGAHYFYVMDQTGAAAAIECTATRAHVQSVTTGTFVHCNHVLADENKKFEASGTPTASTFHRQKRMDALLKGDDPVRPDDMFAYLADHDGAPNSICRHDYNGITSNASVVMSPTDGKLWALHGPACEGDWALYE